MIPRDYLPALHAQIARLIADNRVVILQPTNPDDEGGIDRFLHG